LRYKTHIVSSLTLGAGLSILTNYPFHIGYVLGISFGSLLPDIDEPNSYIGRRSFGISTYVKSKYGHRGITHSLFVWSLVTIVCLLFANPFSIGISLGYIFHLAGDFFSVRSIPVFAPFNNKRPKFPFPYKTGSIVEDIILYVFTFLLFYFVFILGRLHIFLAESTAVLISSTIHLVIEIMKEINSN